MPRPRFEVISPTARVGSGFALLVLLLLAGCGKAPAGPGTGRLAGPPAVPVQVAVAVVEDVPRTIESIGTVQAVRTVTVKSRVDGVIAEVHFREGEEVQAGQPLVTLDRAPFENSLRMARADLVNARAEAVRAEEEMKRNERLGQEQAISREQVAQLFTKAETTRAQVQAKEAAVSNAELLLGYTQILAPIAGRTGQLLLHEGALIKANDAGQSIVTINQIAPIAVAYNVPEPELERVRAAIAAKQATVVVSDRSSGHADVSGRLDFIDNAVDPATGTITLKAVFANATHALWPGQFVFVRTQIGLDRGAIVVPTSAILTGQQGPQIFVLKSDQTVELRVVKIARAVGDRSLLTAGVQAGETVVSDGQLRLVPGARIEVKNPAAPAPARVAVTGETP